LLTPPGNFPFRWGNPDILVERGILTEKTELRREWVWDRNGTSRRPEPLEIRAVGIEFINGLEESRCTLGDGLLRSLVEFGA
jgi:hypothetical protein